MSDSHSRAADAVLSAKGRSFHWARRFLGERQAERATRLYMLCRYVDDIADEADSGPDARQALALMKQDIRLGRSSDPIVADGIRLFAECGIEPGIFIELIDGVESDLGTVRIPDTDALIHYCYQVAGTVGLMMCRILDAKEAAADAHAIDLGIAMQLTNICRDVVADAVLDRRYLPATLVGELAPASLLQPDTGTDAVVRSALSDLLQLADRYYQSGESGRVYLPVASRAGILLADVSGHRVTDALVAAMLLIAALARASGLHALMLAGMVVAMGALNNTFQRDGDFDKSLYASILAHVFRREARDFEELIGELTAEEGVFRVVGRRTWKRPEAWTILYRETSDVPYELVLQHENVIDVDTIHAELSDGILRISLPKSEAIKPRKIAVS